MIKTSQSKSVFPGEVETQVHKSEDKDKARASRFSLAELRLKFVSRMIKTRLEKVGFPRRGCSSVRKWDNKDKAGESRFPLAKLILKFINRRIKTGSTGQIPPAVWA